MPVRKSALAFLILTCFVAAGGQQTPKAANLNKLQSVQSDKLSLLASSVDVHNTLIKDLDRRITALENHGTDETGRYQIATTTVQVDAGLSFTQVFRVDTRTGNVCQVVGPQAAKGELMGSSLPYCTQQ